MSKVTELAEKYGITSNSNDNIEMFAAHLYNDGYHAGKRKNENTALRDHFAGLAMQGFLSLNKFNTDMIVKLSYDMADAMLAERERQ